MVRDGFYLDRGTEIPVPPLSVIELSEQEAKLFAHQIEAIAPEISEEITVKITKPKEVK